MKYVNVYNHVVRTFSEVLPRIEFKGANLKVSHFGGTDPTNDGAKRNALIQVTADYPDEVLAISQLEELGIRANPLLNDKGIHLAVTRVEALRYLDNPKERFSALYLVTYNPNPDEKP